MPDQDAPMTNQTPQDQPDRQDLDGPDPADRAGESTLDADGLTAAERRAADRIAHRYDQLVSGSDGQDDSSADDGDQGAAAGGADSDETGAVGDDEASERSHDSTVEAGPGPQLSARQRDAARHFGLDDDDVAALGPRSIEVLDRLAKVRSDIGRRYSQIGRAEHNARVARGADGEEAGLPDDGGAVETGAAADPGGPTPLEARFDPDVDGPAADRLNRLVETVNGLVRTLGPVSQGVAELRQRQQRDNQRKAEAMAEAFFREASADHPHLGRGATSLLDADSPEARIRGALLEKASEIREGRRIAGGEDMDLHQSLREALAIVSPDSIRSAERRRISQGLRHRSRSIISRPTQRHTGRAFASDEDRAADEIATRARQLGVPLAL